MSPAGFNLGKAIAPIKKPSIGAAVFVLLPSQTEGIQFSFDKVVVYENLDTAGFEIDCRIGRDVIEYRPIKSFVLEPFKLSINIATVVEIQPLLQYLEPVRIFGMNYKHRIWQEIKLAVNDEPVHPKQEKKMRSFTKSYVEPEQLSKSSNKPKPKGPSFWDLIYPLLQPPLILEQIENLWLSGSLRGMAIYGVG